MWKRHRRKAVKEPPITKIHKSTTEAREFLTAAIAADYDIARSIENSTPDLITQLAEIWANYLTFLRTEYGNEEAIEFWQGFCEFGAIASELEHR